MTFADFVSAQQRSLLRFAMVLTGDARLAEEIVADVLARAFESWDRVGTMEQPNAYVRRMIVNEHLSWRRRWARVKPHAELGSLLGVSPDHADGHAEREAMVARLAVLPKRQRAAVVLRFYEGLSDDEIADVLGCRAGTVRSNVSRGLAALRVELDAEDAAEMRGRGR